MAVAEIDAIRELLASRPRPTAWAERRERINAIGAAPIARDIDVMPVDAGGVAAEWSLAPHSDASKALLFFHGGGYCSGSIVSHRPMVTEAGRAAGVRTLAVDYRLSPEHPYPAALDDACAAYGFLRSQGFVPENIAVGGDSAGGNLALALLLRLRQAGEPMPLCAWLLSPWTDLTMSGATMETRAAVDPLVQKPYLVELANAFVGGADAADPMVSPLFADLTGLPPLLIQVGSAETLLADSTRLAQRAGEADVSVRLEVWPHMIHVWPLWADRLAEGRGALAAAGAFIRAGGRAG